MTIKAALPSTIKASLLAALAPSIIEEPVDGYGIVRIKQLSVAENDFIRAAVKAEKDAPQSEFGLRLLAASVVDEDGMTVMTPTDLPALRESSGSKIDSLIKRVLQINGYTTEAEKKVTL